MFCVTCLDVKCLLCDLSVAERILLAQLQRDAFTIQRKRNILRDVLINSINRRLMP